MALSAEAWIAGGKYFVRDDGHSIFYRREGRGPVMLMLHGFPTWSYDYAEIAPLLASHYDVVTPDFLGYGASDKPRDYAFSVPDAADTVEALMASIGVRETHLVIHNYGGIVGQELLDRHRRGVLSFAITSVHLLNCGVVYEEYRPALLQRLLANTLIGGLVARLITKGKVRTGLDKVRGPSHPLTDAEFEELWRGIGRDNGHKLAHRLVRYNHERDVHAARWLEALEAYRGPLHLVWGMADPISGGRVLDALRPRIPNARIDELADVGHFPSSEAPTAVADAIRGSLAT